MLDRHLEDLPGVQIYGAAPLRQHDIYTLHSTIVRFFLIPCATMALPRDMPRGTENMLEPGSLRYLQDIYSAATIGYRVSFSCRNLTLNMLGSVPMFLQGLKVCNPFSGTERKFVRVEPKRNEQWEKPLMSKSPNLSCPCRSRRTIFCTTRAIWKEWKTPKVSIAFGPSKPSKSGDGDRCSRPWMRIGPTSLELIGEPHELLERLGLHLMGFHEVRS
jgi:hypothetical protein